MLWCCQLSFMWIVSVRRGTTSHSVGTKQKRAGFHQCWRASENDVRYWNSRDHWARNLSQMLYDFHHPGGQFEYTFKSTIHFRRVYALYLNNKQSTTKSLLSYSRTRTGGTLELINRRSPRRCFGDAVGAVSIRSLHNNELCFTNLMLDISTHYAHTKAALLMFIQRLILITSSSSHYEALMGNSYRIAHGHYSIHYSCYALECIISAWMLNLMIPWPMKVKLNFIEVLGSANRHSWIFPGKTR